MSRPEGQFKGSHSVRLHEHTAQTSPGGTTYSPLGHSGTKQSMIGSPVVLTPCVPELFELLATEPPLPPEVLPPVPPSLLVPPVA